MASPSDRSMVLSGDSVRISRREAEVLGLIAQGHSSDEVANLLYLSKRTVDFHLANVYQKLGVSNRVQAILAGSRLGVIPAEPAYGNVVDLRGELQEMLVTNRAAKLAASYEQMGKFAAQD